jgi:hypothetical protein
MTTDLHEATLLFDRFTRDFWLKLDKALDICPHETPVSVARALLVLLAEDDYGPITPAQKKLVKTLRYYL